MGSSCAKGTKHLKLLGDIGKKSGAFRSTKTAVKCMEAILQERLCPSRVFPLVCSAMTDVVRHVLTYSHARCMFIQEYGSSSYGPVPNSMCVYLTPIKSVMPTGHVSPLCWAVPCLPWHRVVPDECATGRFPSSLRNGTCVPLCTILRALQCCGLTEWNRLPC